MHLFFSPTTKRNFLRLLKIGWESNRRVMACSYGSIRATCVGPVSEIVAFLCKILSLMQCVV